MCPDVFVMDEPLEVGDEVEPHQPAARLCTALKFLSSNKTRMVQYRRNPQRSETATID